MELVAAIVYAKIAEKLSWASLSITSLTLVLVISLNYVQPPRTESVGTLALLTALAAPIMAILAIMMAKVAGGPVPTVAFVALRWGCLALLWPLFLILLISSCPDGVC